MEDVLVHRARRQSHKKRRSGCGNCKNRHVRCDEEKPDCSNCRKIGLVCSNLQWNQMGVPVYQDVEDFRNSFLPRPRHALSVPKSSGILLNTDGSRALHFFQTQTLPTMCSVFPSELWERSLLAVGHSVPAIMHLTVAIGAYHRKISSLGFDTWQKLGYIDTLDSTILYALEHHAEATRLVRESVSSQNPPIRMIKLACVLFTMLEFLRGNRSATISHLTNGMRLLKLPGKSRQLDPFERGVDSTLSRLSLTQSLYGRPRSTLFPDLWIIPDVACAEPLTTLQDARTAIMNLSNLVLLFVRKVEQSETSPQTLDILAEQERLSLQLSQWSNAVDTLALEIHGNPGRRAIDLLRGYHAISVIFLKTITTQYQTSFDQYIPNFQTFVDNIELVLHTLMDAAEVPVLFSLDLGVIPCLFFTAIKCRHPQIRRRAVALLRKAPQRECLWNAEEAAIVAEQAIKFEERYIGDAEAEGAYCIPEEARLHDVDIREMSLEGEESISIVFRWRPYATCTKLEESHVCIRRFANASV